MTRTKILLGSLLGAMAIHLALLACSGPDRSGADGGGVLDAIADVMGKIGDAERPGEAAAQTQDAGGPRAIEAPCDVVVGSLVYASVSATGLRAEDAPRVGAALCGLPAAGGAAPPGVDLAGACSNASYWVAPGRVVVLCGSSGAAARSARVTLP